MKVKYLGFKGVDFVNSAGVVIKGTTMYYAFKSDGVIGLCADKVFLKPSIELPVGIKSGDEIDICFDNKGKVTELSK